MGVVVRLAMLLPRDRSSVPVTRRLLDAALGALGVNRDTRADIELAVGEACANVVEHARGAQEYEVVIAIEDDRCVIDVADTGVGIDATAVADRVAGPDEESGRGLRIIRTLVDVVELRRRAPRGATLHIIKMLPGRLPVTV